MNFKTDNTFDNPLMSKFVLSKYKHNIDKIVDSILIFPKDYKRVSTLDMRWKVYFFYRRDGVKKQFNRSSYYYNGQLVQINRTSDHKLKVNQIHHLRDTLIYDLKNDPKLITILLYGYDEALRLYPSVFDKKIVRNLISIEAAFEYALEFKKGKVSESFYSDLKSVKNRFLKFISSNSQNDIRLLDKKMLLDFISSIGGSNKTFNNAKANLSALLSVMLEAEYISKNYLLEVKNLKTTPTINKAFTSKEVTKILGHIKEKDEPLYWYCMHIYYGLMRPVTVSRLRTEDIKDGVFNTDTKTGNYIKLIPLQLRDFYKSVDLHSGYVFGYKGLFEDWNANDKTRQGYYGKKFSKIKKELGFSNEYTLYSFRHSAIGQIYDNKFKELREAGVPNYKLEALKFIQQFTEHKTTDNVLKYLRGISTLVHVDWSDYLK